jgi:hypothetical protein
MSRVEDWKDTMDAQLNGSYGQTGLIQQMRNFLEARKKSDNSLVWKIAIAAILLPIGYDVIKHLIGWH